MYSLSAFAHFFILSCLFYLFVFLFSLTFFFRSFFCRCPEGTIRATPERAECVFDSDCFGVNQCLNGGTCISENGFTGPTFSGPGISARTLCLCPPFYEGARCEIVTDKNITLTGSRDFVIIIIFAIASLLSKFFSFFIFMHVVPVRKLVVT